MSETRDAIWRRYWRTIALFSAMLLAVATVNNIHLRRMARQAQVGQAGALATAAGAQKAARDSQEGWEQAIAIGRKAIAQRDEAYQDALRSKASRIRVMTVQPEAMFIHVDQTNIMQEAKP